MPTLKQQIDAKFLAQLSESRDLPPETIDQLRQHLSTGKKPKVAELVDLFSHRTGSEVQ